MVKRKTLRIITVICAAFLLIALYGAQEVIAEKNLVCDDADLYTATEESKLSLDAKALGEAYNLDIVIVTTNDAKGKSSREYADDFFDYNGYGVGEERDGILFLIDMDNREVYISTSGKGIRYLTDNRIEKILDDVFANGLTEDLMYDATNAFLRSTERYLQAGIPSNQYNKPSTTILEKGLTMPEAIAGTVVSVVVGVGFFLLTRHRYQGKPKPVEYRYQEKNRTNFKVNTEKLVDSSVTYTIIQESSSSGRSSTHTSSSGRTHGGGGRKF